jgi:ComF family protein
MIPATSAIRRRIVDPILAVVFPSRCPACQASLSAPTAGPLCGTCWQGVPRHRQPLCACGVPVAVAGPCGRCRRGLTLITLGASLGPYEGSLRLLLHELKYRGRRRVAPRLAEALLDTPEADRVLGGGDLLLPVPLHPKKRRARGFNQSELLARAIASRARLPVGSALRRAKNTRSQTGLSAAARRSNVRGAFAIRRPAAVEGRVVVLVDDVVTTGATSLACARVLRGAGVADVRLLTAARAY